MATKQAVAQRRVTALGRIEKAAGYLETEKGFPPLVFPTYNPDKTYEQMLQFETLAGYLETVVGRVVTGSVVLPDPIPNGTDDNEEDTVKIETVPPVNDDKGSVLNDPPDTGDKTLDPKKDETPPLSDEPKG